MVRCTVFPTFLEQGFLIMAHTGHQQFFFFPIEIFISFVCYEIGIVKSFNTTTRIFALEI